MVSGIYNISTVVPAIGFALLGIILLLWYPLKRDKVFENGKILAERHKNPS